MRGSKALMEAIYDGSSLEEMTQKEKDKESIRDDGVIWRTSPSGHVIGIDPRTGKTVKGNPNHPAVKGKGEKKGAKGEEAKAEKAISNVRDMAKAGIGVDDLEDVMGGEYEIKVSNAIAPAKEFIEKNAPDGGKEHLKVIRAVQDEIESAQEKLQKEPYGFAGRDNARRMSKALEKLAAVTEKALKSTY